MNEPKLDLKTYLRRNGAWLGFFALALALAFMTDGGFLSSRNLTNLLRQTAINGVLAGGMTLVILTGGIDLSIGSIVALAGVAAGISQVNWGWADLGLRGALGSMALAIAVGGGAGFINGGLVALLGIPPFVITLGMMVIARGVALILTDGSGISPMGATLRPIGEDYLSHPATIALVVVLLALFVCKFRKNVTEALFPVLTFGWLGYAFLTYKGFPIPVVFLLACMGATGFLLVQTTLGRCVYAVGSNEQAAYWAGVPVKKVKWFVYTALGLFSGLAGVLLSARLNSAVPTAGNLFELDAIAAVVIGGTSLKGGTGSILGSFVGALTIATLNNGMDLLAVPSFYQMVLKGVIIVLAVSLDKGQRQAT